MQDQGTQEGGCHAARMCRGWLSEHDKIGTWVLQAAYAQGKTLHDRWLRKHGQLVVKVRVLLRPQSDCKEASGVRLTRKIREVPVTSPTHDAANGQPKQRRRGGNAHASARRRGVVKHRDRVSLDKVCYYLPAGAGGGLARAG